MNHYHTIIIGAGAAGLAAGRRLHDAGRAILILEARDRIGGRIWTDEHFAAFPIDLGAEFIHGEKAVTHELVRAAGLHTLAAPRYPNLRWATAGPARAQKDWSAAEQALISQLFAALHALPTFAVPYTQQDRSLADHLRQQGFDGAALAVADVLLAQTCCATLETLSCADLIREQQVDHAGYEEAHIGEGYSALLRWYSRDLPVRLRTPVQRVHWHRQGVTVVADQTSFTAERCLITVPVSLLQAGMIDFDPPLSVTKQQAIQALRLEPATKLIYRFREPLWDDELVFMAHTGVVARWWTPGYGRPAANVISAFVTAERARQIDQLPEAAALALGLAELSQLLGILQLAQHCDAARRVAWAHDPYARGGYAHVPPGAAQARLALATPEGDRLFFAGEATAHDTNPQTVHGAIESGWRAAQECL